MANFLKQYLVLQFTFSIKLNNQVLWCWKKGAITQSGRWCTFTPASWPDYSRASRSLEQPQVWSPSNTNTGANCHHTLDQVAHPFIIDINTPAFPTIWNHPMYSLDFFLPFTIPRYSSTPPTIFHELLSINGPKLQNLLYHTPSLISLM